MEESNKTQETRHLDKTEEIAERWQKIKGLFEKATSLTGKEREDFLRSSCGKDAELRQVVERLLASFEDSESFLENPAVAEVASIFDAKRTLVGQSTTGDIKNGSFVAGTVLASRYRIIGLLGKGGMGEVYKAEDIKLSQTVALKFLPDKLEKNKEALERFHAEVRNARQVAHVNVCKVFDIGEIDGKHFLSMEFIDGDDLSSLLRRVGRLSSERAIEIARQLCVGLSAIHNAGILHRDLKPANVIIDSKGKTRITDFGIAGLEDEAAHDQIRVGTPAYMSPEQITGKDVSQKSDIYALGLVLYEIFTGKQAFAAESVPELIRKQTSETPTNPSEYVKGIDPLVESVIGQCLQKNPDDRPQTALHVAMSLPGGNPMQIALEAGETPSPEMVAASPQKGALKPVIALACLVGGIAMLGLMMFVSMKVAPQNRIPFNKSADVLSEKANEIISKFGYTDTPAERWYRFHEDYSYLDYFVRNESPKKRFANIESGQPLFCVFVERQSPTNFEVSMMGSGLWTFGPQSESSQRKISLDTRGRLVEFSAVPPKFGSVTDSKADFSATFQAAELDLAKFKEVSPNWTPASAFDERKAWEGVLPDNEEIPLRVEAASYQGKIVFFKMVYPWTKSDPDGSLANTTRDWVGVFVFAGILIGIMVTAIFLAWRNIKSGSGDRKGAFKISIAIFILVFLGWIFGSNHVPSFSHELDRVTLGFRGALYLSVLTCIVYLALEPIIRRNLPDLIVSWNRLLAGDFADPLVGRDILLGTLVGVAHLTLIYVGLYAEQLIHGDLRLFFFSGGLNSLQSWTAGIFGIAGYGFFPALTQICVFAILYLVLRRRLYAGLFVFALIATVLILFFTQSWIFLVFTLVMTAVLSLAIAKLGLITMVVAQIVFMWLEATLLTLNFSAWFASGMLLTLGLVLVLLVYGFKTSLANQPFFAGRLTTE